MQVLLSSIGTRGDIQPLVALALELRALGQRTKLCVPPNFKDWIESYGLEVIPIGPDLKKFTSGAAPGISGMPSQEQLQQMADQSVRDQFRILGEAARGCDLILAATALQFAARSVAEVQKIPYVFAVYCPAVLPSASYPPPKNSGFHPQALPEAENLQLWQENEASFKRFSPAINAERAKLGLGPVTSVRDDMFTDRPWLAAEPALAPAYPLPGMQVVQDGAWLIPDQRELPEDLERFLAGGAPPIYLGFGSMRGSEQTARVLVEAARALGLRALLSQGWANLTPGDAGDDCLSIGDVNYEKLFPRVAAVVHHGGAGTTHAAARAGAAQVIVPHNYDQAYWAHRLEQVGAGVQGPLSAELSADSLAQALRACLRPEVAARARELAGRMGRDGAHLAAQRVVSEFG